MGRMGVEGRLPFFSRIGSDVTAPYPTLFHLLSFLGFTVLVTSSANADIIVFEDFEDATVNYTTNVSDDLTDIANKDYFGRIATDTAMPPADVVYNNLQGAGYYGVQDSDHANSGDIDLIQLDFSGIDISNFHNLEFEFMVAEDDAVDGNEDWDTTSSLRVLYQIDGSGYQNLFAIESESIDGDQTNEAPRVDTDFDGIGDGAFITDTFALFASSIGSTGSTLDLRLIIEDLETGDEDIAIDNITIRGELSAVPEAGAGGIVVLLFVALGYNRRWNKRWSRRWSRRRN